MPTLEPITPQPHLHAFAGYGIELEYMIVDQRSLAVRPLADVLLRDAAGLIVNEVEHGPLAWSNELVMHVIELKTNGPAATLSGLAQRFHADVQVINQALAAHGARLMPTAMHPLFDPARETRLWPHGQNEIYAAYDRIFGCRGHGWSNLQSMHINLPFFDDEEFRRLHAAIRVVLPIIPALAAASPLQQGRVAGWVNQRLRYYRDNQRAVPEISGQVVPEAVAGIDDYRQRILAPMYQAIAPLDATDLLADDWLNSRAAIARFERQTIEIRIIDLQECPAADLAIAEAVVGLVRAFYTENLATFEHQQSLSTAALADVLWQAAEFGGQALIEDPAYLALFGQTAAMPAAQLWRNALASLALAPEVVALLQQMLDRGTLAEAILAVLGQQASQADILACYRELCQCLDSNQLFRS